MQSCFESDSSKLKIGYILKMFIILWLIAFAWIHVGVFWKCCFIILTGVV